MLVFTNTKMAIIYCAILICGFLLTFDCVVSSPRSRRRHYLNNRNDDSLKFVNFRTQPHHNIDNIDTESKEKIKRDLSNITVLSQPIQLNLTSDEYVEKTTNSNDTSNFTSSTSTPFTKTQSNVTNNFTANSNFTTISPNSVYEHIYTENRSSDFQNDNHSVENLRRQIEQIHIETMKLRILDKLRLEAPPILNNSSKSIPIRAIQQHYVKDAPIRTRGRRLADPSQFYAKTKQIVVLGEDVTSICQSSKHIACLFFNITNEVTIEQVNKAELWVYKLHHINDPHIQTFTVSELGKEPLEVMRRPRNLVQRAETSVRNGWIKVNIKSAVINWLKNPDKNLGIAIICRDCHHRRHRKMFSSKRGTEPYLAINVKKAKSRHSRSPPIVCREHTTTCCLMPLTINFEALGWTGVVHPATFEANYCRGSCHAPHLAHSNHTQMIQNHRWNSDSLGTMRRLTPCCAPTSYEPLTILVIRENVIVVEKIPNLVATSCGCL